MLCIHPPIFLGYHDSGYPLEFAQRNPQAFMHVAIKEIEARLLEPIAALRPEIILTFDPSRFYGHIDHKVIHRAATAAFWSAGKVMQPAPKRLFYPVPQGDSGQLVSEDSVTVRIEVRLFEPQIRSALLAHRSQVGSHLQAIERDWPHTFVEEAYVLAGLRGGFPAMPVGDLLEGL